MIRKAIVDEITGTCFACFDRFEVMATVSMLYFAAAHYCEERERSGKASPNAAFLLADSSKFDVVQFERIGPLSGLDDLVTEVAPPRKLATAIKNAGLTLRIAPR